MVIDKLISLVQHLSDLLTQFKVEGASLSMAKVTCVTLNPDPLSLSLIPSGRLKNLRDVDKWSLLSLCLSVKGMSVT